MARPVTPFGARPTHQSHAKTLTHSDASERAQLMEGITAGVLIPEIVRRDFLDLLEVRVSAGIGAQRHERCPQE
jgi:putative transposase